MLEEEVILLDINSIKILTTNLLTLVFEKEKNI